MLVVVHNGNVERALQTFLNIETLRGFDILKVDASKSWGNLLNSLAELLWVFLSNFNIEYIDTTIYLEKQTFTLHHGFSTHGTDIAQTEYCSTI